MSIAKLSLTNSSIFDSTADLLVLGVVRGADGLELAGKAEIPELAAILPQLGLSGAVEEVHRVPAFGGLTKAVLLVGLGDAPSRESLRLAAGVAARCAAGVSSLALGLPVQDAEEAEAVLVEAASAAYAFLDYRTGDLEGKRPPAQITLHVPEGLPQEGIVSRAHSTAKAIHTVRDLVNTPAKELYPESFAARAQELVEHLPVKLTVLGEKELIDGGYGGLLGVGSGSVRGPRMVLLRYTPEGADKHLALVGKGITFDSGGLSLKPASSMMGMKYDMTGAATVLAVLLAVARLGFPVRVSAWLCLAENMPSGSALRPGDVVRTRCGTTVEVTNTDAEGRLVLADGLADAAAERPDLLIDVATLTGAARAALGERTTGVMGDNDAVQLVVDAAKTVDENVWPMPLPVELRAVLESDIADLVNAKIGHTAGGMLVAGQFLRCFVGESGGSEGPGARLGWAHLDVAGTAGHSGAPYGGIAPGPTGVTVRTLLAVAEKLAS